MHVGFIGAGKVGVSLGKYFCENGIKLSGYYSKNINSSIEAAKFTDSKAYYSMEDLLFNSNVLFITTPDDIIRDIWQNICFLDLKDKIICHTSGSLSSDIFSNINNSGAYGYSIHPMFAFSDKFNSYKNLKNAFFTIEGDVEHINTLKILIESFGNNVLIINKEQKPLYHLANVSASNLVLSLLQISSSYLEHCGISSEHSLKALMPLIENNISNLKQKGFIPSLTGPIERNDIDTITRHIDSIPDKHLNLYRILSLNLLLLAKEKHTERNYTALYECLSKTLKGEI